MTAEPLDVMKRATQAWERKDSSAWHAVMDNVSASEYQAVVDTLEKQTRDAGVDSWWISDQGDVLSSERLRDLMKKGHEKASEEVRSMHIKPVVAAQAMTDALGQGLSGWCSLLLPLVFPIDYPYVLRGDSVVALPRLHGIMIEMARGVGKDQTVETFVVLMRKAVKINCFGLAAKIYDIADGMGRQEELKNSLHDVLRFSFNLEHEKITRWLVQTVGVEPASVVYDMICENEYEHADDLAVLSTGAALAQCLNLAQEGDSDMELDEDMPLSQTKHKAEKRAEKARPLPAKTRSSRQRYRS